MRGKLTAVVAVLALALAVTALAQQTPAPMVATYDSLADAILGLKQAEHDFVHSVLHHHMRAAQMNMAAGDFDVAAAEMAMFANEGDNAIAGVRKRLLDGGHHHNAEGEAQGIYEPGYVIVTREAKEGLLAAAAAMRSATEATAAEAAWESFTAAAHSLMQSEH